MRETSGFTLMELMIAVLIIGVLAAIGVPNYFKSVETRHADAACELAVTIAAANQMYAAGHNGSYVAGQLSSACAGQGCGSGNACDLIACNYLPPQDFSDMAYNFTVNGSAGVSVTMNPTSVYYRGKYKGWGYNVSNVGYATPQGGAPMPPEYRIGSRGSKMQ